ncbi:unnamed protein product [Schistocephalus solidus]|uniref:Wax ester/triacylglycerol synthase family O-acyltransferase n=1 Tax=Schistocephalus solidus TaxID=70667 RepID=A0A183SV61_SCHSO|nr:unnamed protein product [Schistocephalus solidus]
MRPTSTSWASAWGETASSLPTWFDLVGGRDIWVGLVSHVAGGILPVQTTRIILVENVTPPRALANEQELYVTA